MDKITSVGISEKFLLKDGGTLVIEDISEEIDLEKDMEVEFVEYWIEYAAPRKWEFGYENIEEFLIFLNKEVRPA